MKNNKQRKTNLLYLAFAFIIAVGIWYYVDEHNGRTATVTISDVPIEYLGESGLADRGLMLLSGEGSGTDLTVDFELEGLRRKVVQMDQSKLRVTVDLSKVTSAGVQMISYTPSFTDRRLSSSVIQIKETSINNATVNIVELNRKDVEVRCEVTGNVADGYIAGKLNLSKDVIEVRGQASDIDAVSYAKVFLDIGKDVKESVSKVLQCSFYDENDRLLADREIHTKDLDIKVMLPVYVTKELKITMDFLESAGAKLADMSWTVSPESIVVSGDASVLNGMSSIRLGEFDLLNVGPDVSTHSYSIIVPDGCENLSGVTRATLEISYPKLKTKTLEIPQSRFLYLNAPENKELSVHTEALSIDVFGPAPVIDAITPEDVEIVIDMGDYAALSGTCTVTAYGKVNEDLNVGFRGNYEVQVTIQDAKIEQENSL